MTLSSSALEATTAAAVTTSAQSVARYKHMHIYLYASTSIAEIKDDTGTGLKVYELEHMLLQAAPKT